MLKKAHLLGVGITSESEETILEYLFESLKNNKKKLFIITPNPEILVYANHHPAYKDKLNQADISLPDGIGIFIGIGILGNRLKERIPGADFMEEICKWVNGKPVSIGLLGGRRGVAEKTAQCLKKKYPSLNIVFASDEWPTKIENGQLSTLNSQLSSPVDFLFVAFGFPKQEEWIYENLDKFPVKAAMGVGGAFDYISGAVPRAPYLIRAMGFEWLYRLIRQPWRLKRQLALGEFVWLVLQELSKKYIYH